MNKKTYIAASTLTIIIFYSIVMIFFSKNYSYDAIGYSISVRDTNFNEIFHPYHLIYTYLFFLFYKIISFFTLIQPHIAGQVFSLVSALIALVFMYMLTYELFFDKITALAAALFFNFSLWFMYYSMDVELHIPNIAGLIIAVYLVNKIIVDHNRITERLLAALCAFMLLMHQLNFFLWGISFCFSLYYSSGKKKTVVLWIVSVVVLAVLPYIIIPRYYFNIKNPAEMIRWLTRYQSKGYWSGITGNYFLESILGLTTSILGGGVYKQIIIAMAGTGTIIFYIFKAISRKIRGIEVYIIALFVCYAGIIIYWHPANPENWWALLYFILLVFLFAENLIIMKKKFEYSIRCLLVVLFLYQLYAVIYGYIIKYHKREFNKTLVLTEKLNKMYGDGNNLIICPGEGDYAGLSMYLKYFTKLQFISMAVEFDRFDGSLDKTLNQIEKSMNKNFTQIIFTEDMFDRRPFEQLARMHRIPELPDIMNNYYIEIFRARNNVIKQGK